MCKLGIFCRLQFVSQFVCKTLRVSTSLPFSVLSSAASSYKQKFSRENYFEIKLHFHTHQKHITAQFNYVLPCLATKS